MTPLPTVHFMKAKKFDPIEFPCPHYQIRFLEERKRNHTSDINKSKKPGFIIYSNDFKSAN